MGGSPTVLQKRSANAERDIPAMSANRAIVQLCLISACSAPSAAEMRWSARPASNPCWLSLPVRAGVSDHLHEKEFEQPIEHQGYALDDPTPLRRRSNSSTPLSRAALCACDGTSTMSGNTDCCSVELMSSNLKWPPRRRSRGSDVPTPIVVSCTPDGASGRMKPAGTRAGPVPSVQIGGAARKKKSPSLNGRGACPGIWKTQLPLTIWQNTAPSWLGNRTAHSPCASNCFHSSPRGRSSRNCLAQGVHLDDLKCYSVGQL